MMTNKKKNVSKEIAQNNRVCITACEGGNWMRIDCNLIDDSDNKEAKQKALDEFPWADSLGYSMDNPDFQVLYIENAEVTYNNVAGKVLKTYKF